MRQFLIIILFTFVPYLANAVSVYDTTEQQTIATMQGDVDLMRDNDIQKIRNFINKENPEFINEISNLSEQEQTTKMRNYLAKKAFDYYYDKYMDELKQKSQETGREIKTRQTKDDFIENHWWLDRGDLDTEKCKQDDFISCDYPDGFEEYSIDLRFQNNIEDAEDFTIRLTIEKDDIKNNANNVFLITLSAHQPKNSENTEYVVSTHAILDVTGFSEKYDEHHRWRNQQAADVRAGKYAPAKAGKRTKTAKKEWQSDVFPEVAITSITTNFDSSYTQKK